MVISCIAIITIMDKKTTVSLDEETKEQLKKFGSKGESYNKILTRVMNKADRLCNKSSKNDDVAVDESNEEQEE